MIAKNFGAYAKRRFYAPKRKNTKAIVVEEKHGDECVRAGGN